MYLRVYDASGALKNSAPTLPHSSTTGQTTDDHHAKLHASDHASGGADTISVGLAELDTDLGDIQDNFIGVALDSPVVTVTSNGTVITLSVEKSGGGNIRLLFAAGITTWVTAPDTIALTVGSDISPQINYVYYLKSTNLLTVSTSDFPTTEEHAPIAVVLCQSAASLQTDGAYKMHAWTDHVVDAVDGMGHQAHLSHWIRHQNATHKSGAALTPTVGAATFDIATSSGELFQLHDHSFPAFNTAVSSVVFIINHPDTAFRRATDLTQTFVDKDINGTVLGSGATDHYNLVIWGVVNEADSDCKLMCNLPDGAYNNNNADKATLDVEQTAIYTIPSDFVGVGFLIARLTVQEIGGTYTILQNEDLRGQLPTIVAGGSPVGGNEFSDNTFRIQDDGDVTKEIAFQASGITTATVRTITMPDADVDLGALGAFAADGDTQITPVTPIVLTGSSGIKIGLDWSLEINQSGTAGYDADFVDVTETATGSGAKYLHRRAVGGVDKYYFDNNGQLHLDPAGAFGVTTGLAFGNGDTILYEGADDVVNFRIAGSTSYTFSDARFSANDGPALLNEVPTATNPVHVPTFTDSDTGAGSAGPDIYSLIAGAVEAHRMTEVGGAIVHDLTGVATLITGHTIAGLPTPALGMIARITDGDGGLAWGATAVSSGGSTPYLVWYNGTNWTIMGK